jgi:LmbE family N-acetylglucosaminyl deacetylase
VHQDPIELRFMERSTYVELAKSSSVLLIAAHPDDIKNWTGIVLRCLDMGVPVFEVLVTKGECLKYRSGDTRESALEMGKTRQEELLRFYDALGLPRENLAIIGIPDGRITLGALREDFFEAESDPFYDPVLLTDHVIYDDAYKPGMPFFGQSLLAVLKEFLVVRQPTHVFTHHPKDDHPDHRAVYAFAKRAVDQTMAAGDLRQRPELYASLVYFQRLEWPPEGDSFLTPEIQARPYGFEIVRVPLSESEFERKRQACMIFTPLLSVDYITSYMKRDELLWRVVP